jgi:hypothetical protein
MTSSGSQGTSCQSHWGRIRTRPSARRRRSARGLHQRLAQRPSSTSLRPSTIRHGRCQSERSMPWPLP